MTEITKDGTDRKDPLSGRFVKMLTDEQRRAHRRRSVARHNAKRKVEHWEWQLWHKYGLTHLDFIQLLADQGGGCAICGAIYSVKIAGKNRKLHVDHDHKTGAVRGILCFKCNTGLGRFNEDPILFQRAIEYLGKECAK